MLSSGEPAGGVKPDKIEALKRIGALIHQALDITESADEESSFLDALDADLWRWRDAIAEFIDDPWEE